MRQAVGNFVARANKVRLDRAIKLLLAEVVLPARVVLNFFRCASVVSLFNNYGVVHEQHGGAAVELGTDDVEEMAEKVAEACVPLGSNTTGCSLSLAGTGGKFEKARALINGAVAKHAEVRDVCVVSLPGSVEVEVMKAVSSQ
eukprot:3170737-Pleurochrysis_carterae.AAC.2